MSTKPPLSCVRFSVLLELLKLFEPLKSALRSDPLRFSLHRGSATLHMYIYIYFFFSVSDLLCFLLLLLTFTSQTPILFGMF